MDIEVADIVGSNYGHAGPAFIESVILDRAAIKADYKKAAEWFVKKLGYSAEARFSLQAAALLLVAAWRVKRYGILDVDVPALASYLLAAARGKWVESGKKKAREADIMQRLLEYCSTQQAQFLQTTGYRATLDDSSGQKAIQARNISIPTIVRGQLVVPENGSDEMTCYVAHAPFVDRLRTKNFNAPETTLEELVKRGLVEIRSAAVGRGVASFHWAGAIKCIVFTRKNGKE